MQNRGYATLRPDRGAKAPTWSDTGSSRSLRHRSGISDRSLSQRARSLCTMLDLGFRQWQVLGSNQRRLSRRFYIPEGAGRGQGGCARFSSVSGRGSGHAGRKAWVKVEGPAGRTTLTLAFLPAHAGGAGNDMGLWGVRAPCAVRVLGQARGCVHPFGCARGWLLRGHGAGSRAGSGINQAVGRPAGGRGPVKPAITRCPRPGLLTRPAGRRQPGTGPGRRAWRRRPT